MKIALTGSIAYDYLMTFPGHFKDHILPEKIESISLSFLVDGMIKRRGGVAPNIGYSMSLLGSDPCLFGAVGEDFGMYREWLEKNGVDTRGVKVIPGEFTASFFATTDRINAQIASFYPGAMAHAAEIKLSDWKEEPFDLVVISPNDPQAMINYVEEAQKLGISYLYDPSQQIVRLSGEELKEGVEGAFALFVNDYEFGLIQKRTGMSEQEIREAVTLMVVTKGDKGAVIWAEEEEHRVPVVPPAEIQDPTGVGDAFRAGFLTGYHYGLDWKLCGQMGSLAATYCLEEDGPQGQTYTIGDFKRRFRQHFDDRGALEILQERDVETA